MKYGDSQNLSESDFQRLTGVGRDTFSHMVNILRTEDVLSGHPDFALPSKKALTESEISSFVTLDVTKIPVERPKKNSVATTPGKRNRTP